MLARHSKVLSQFAPHTILPPSLGLSAACLDLQHSDLLFLAPTPPKVCCECHGMLVSRVPAFLPPMQRKISCPTCRTRVVVGEEGCGRVWAGSHLFVPVGPTTLLVIRLHALLAQTPTLSHTSLPLANTRYPLTPPPTLPHTPAPADIAFIDTGGTSGRVEVEEQGGGGAVALVADEGAVRVSGSYGTKLEAVVRRILHITRQDPTSKVRRSGGCVVPWRVMPLSHFCILHSPADTPPPR